MVKRSSVYCAKKIYFAFDYILTPHIVSENQQQIQEWDMGYGSLTQQNH